MDLRSFVGATPSSIGLCACLQGEPLAAQLGSPATAESRCMDRAALAPSGVTTCSQVMALSQLRPSPLPSSAEGSARSASGAGKGALIGGGVGLAAGVLSAALLASGCEENQSKCTVMLIVGGAALGAGTGALIGAIASSSSSGEDTTASRTHVALSAWRFTHPGRSCSPEPMPAPSGCCPVFPRPAR
jgi:hypothetical protein